jgi:hypothetical protein
LFYAALVGAIVVFLIGLAMFFRNRSRESPSTLGGRLFSPKVMRPSFFIKRPERRH